MPEPVPAKKSKASDKKILVIDDDASVVSLFRTTLEIEGFQVKTARDGRDVVKTSAQFLPDLIISDLMMPGAGGYDVLRSLQGDPLTRAIPVLLVTGSNMNESTKAMMHQESNMAGYLEKPVRPEKLARQAHKILNTMSKQEEQSAPSPDLQSPFRQGFE